MKKHIFLSVAAMSLALFAAVSCVDNNLGPAKAGTTIKVEEHSSVAGASLLKLEGNKTVQAASDGDLMLDLTSYKAIEAPAPALSATPQLISGSIEISGEDAPAVSKIASGAELEAPALVITVTNPYDVIMGIEGEVHVGKEKNQYFAIPEVEIPAGKTLEIACVKESSGDTKSDVEVVLPAKGAELLKAVPELITLENFKVKGVATKSGNATAASNGPIKIDAAYKSVLRFSKNSKIVISRSFKDLGFDLSKYVSYEASQYSVSINATSSIPADIDVAVASEGYTATLDSPIKAGTVASPVTTAAKLTVKSPKSPVSKLNDMDIKVTLSSPSAFSLSNKQKLDLDLDSIHIDIVQ